MREARAYQQKLSGKNDQKKMNGKELLAHIRSLTMQMDDDEKEKFYDEAEKEGF